MADYTPVTTAAFSHRAQDELDQILRGLLHDLHHVIPEHEIVLSLASAVRSALLEEVPDQDLPAAVDSAVRSNWASLTGVPISAALGQDGEPVLQRPTRPGPVSGVGMLQLDADMRIAALDDQARLVLGTGGTGLTGTSVLDLVDTAARTSTDSALRRAGADGARALVVPLQTDTGQHAILATAPISGTQPRMRACAVARIPEVPAQRSARDRREPPADVTDYCLIECAVDAGADPVDLPELATELRSALGPAARVHTDRDRIAALLPAQGTIAALRHADRMAQLMRAICGAQGLGHAQLDTTMVCVGSRRSLLRLLHRDDAEQV